MKTHKVIIGVTTSENHNFWMWFTTVMAVYLKGAKAVRIKPSRMTDLSQCHGFIISGGVDINPELYGQRNEHSVDIEPERDKQEKTVIQHALEHKKPLLGICRGAQMINIVKGGNLHQNAREFYDGFVPTDSLLGKIFTRRRVLIDRKSQLATLLEGRRKVLVNSLHHQAINELGEGLCVSARDELGIIQAIESSPGDEPFILGVQWHPELMAYNRIQARLFKKLIYECAKRRN